VSTIVTGAARGIGRAVTSRLLADGHRVVAIDLDTSPLDVLEDSELVVVAGDARDTRVLEQACEIAGDVHGLVASAGISRPGPSVGYSGADWEAILGLNLAAVFELMRIAAPRASAGASFVAISSVTATQGFAGRAAYSASKSGVEGMVRSLAIEFAPAIRVNTVSPGFIMTDIARRNIADGIIDSPSILSRTPMARWGDPEDVANAVAFLLSDQAAWITGTTIAVDGGWLARGLGMPT
jgi:NAD(P)-dependent dehydrogenase (short-subunit alcohol dehydrogenase family)